MRSNLCPTSYISHQKLCTQTRTHWTATETVTIKKTAHTIWDSHSPGFRKDNLAKWKGGSDDVIGKRNKVSWRKASQMTEQHTHTLTHVHTPTFPSQWTTCRFSHGQQVVSKVKHSAYAVIYNHLRPDRRKKKEMYTERVPHCRAQWYWLLAVVGTVNNFQFGFCQDL